MKQLALRLNGDRELEIENGLVFVTCGEFEGEVVLYDSDDDETDQAICNVVVPDGHGPLEVLIPYNYLRPLTREQYENLLY